MLRVQLRLEFKEYIPILVDGLLHHKTKQEFTFCVDNAKAHMKAVLQLGYKKRRGYSSGTGSVTQFVIRPYNMRVCASHASKVL